MTIIGTISELKDQMKDQDTIIMQLQIELSNKSIKQKRIRSSKIAPILS